MTVQTDPEATEIKHLRRYAEFGPRPSKRVLEIGCGDGRLTWRYAASAAQVMGIDLQPHDLRVALGDRPANLARRVQFALADAENLPVGKHAFDLAIFAWSF